MVYYICLLSLTRFLLLAFTDNRRDVVLIDCIARAEHRCRSTGDLPEQLWQSSSS
jgi:hypothetical protein